MKVQHYTKLIFTDLLKKYFSDHPTPQDYVEVNRLYPPAQIETIKEVEKNLAIKLPHDYIDFLLLTNGFGGKLGESYSVFTKIEEIEKYTLDYCGDFYPWAIYIGGDGGNEMYVIDKRPTKFNFGLLPYIGEENDFINLGYTFEGFVRHLYYNDFWNIKK